MDNESNGLEPVNEDISSDNISTENVSAENVSSEQDNADNTVQNTPQENIPAQNNIPPVSPPIQYMPAPPQKRLSTGWIVALSITIAVMFGIILFLSAEIIIKLNNFPKDTGKYNNIETQTAELSKPSSAKVNITLPTFPRPVLEPELYADEATGLLTTEGVAEKVMQSQVYIGIYNDGPYKETARGSGVVLSADGYILTNAHVIDGAKDIKIATHGGEQYQAKVIGID